MKIKERKQRRKSEEPHNCGAIVIKKNEEKNRKNKRRKRKKKAPLNCGAIVIIRKEE